MELQKELKQKNAPAAILLAAALLCVAALGALTVYSADDYWYATFFRDGFSGWLALMREHYLTFNGRMLIHTVAQILLALGTWSFALAAAAACAWIPVSAALAGRRTRSEGLLTAALFAMGWLALPLAMKREGLFWISAFCNYVLPTAMICGEMLVLRRLRERGGFSAGQAALLCLLALCCGATTEQSGLAALAMALYSVLAARSGRARAESALAALCAGAGVLTIFLSPATRSRMSSEIGGSSLRQGPVRVLAARLQGAAGILGENWTPVLLLAALVLMTGILLGRKTGKKTPAAVGAGLAAAALLAFAAGLHRTLLFLILLGLAAVSALLLLWLDRETAGTLVLAAGVSLAVILPTNSVVPRTCVPFCLYLLAAVCLLAGELLGQAPVPLRLGCLVGAAAAAAVVLAPVAAGFWYNYQLEQRNDRAARESPETGEFCYWMDYDMRYTHFKPFSDGYFLTTYLEWKEIGEDVEFYIRGANMFDLTVDGERLCFGATIHEGRVLLPVREVVEAAGGTVGTTGIRNGLIVTLEGREYRADNGDPAVSRWSWEENGAPREMEVPWFYNGAKMYFDQSLYTQLFGLEVVPEEDGSVRVYS